VSTPFPFKVLAWVRPEKPRLQTLLALSFGAMSLAIVSTVFLVMRFETERQVVRIVHRELQQVSEQAADRITKWMYERSVDTQSLAGEMGRVRSLEKRQASLDEIRDIYTSSVSWVGVIDNSCTVSQASASMLVGSTIPKEECEAAKREPLMSHAKPDHRLQTDRVSPSDPMTFITLSYPIKDWETGDRLGYAAIKIRTNHLDMLVNAVKIRVAEGHPTETFVISKNSDKILFGKDCYETALTKDFIQDIESARADTFVAWPDGDRFISGAFQTKAFRNIPNLNWIVATRAVRGDALGLVDDLMTRLAIWGFALSLTALGLGLYLARVLGHPLKMLTRAAKHDDDLELREFDQVRYHEIEELNLALRARFSDLKEAKDHIQMALEERSAALADREALLKEVHHRVKNNLQVIISLMRLQGSRVRQNPKGRAVIERLTSRVQVLGWLYSKLYEKAIFSHIDARDILIPLLQQVQDTYPSDVTIESKIDSVLLGFDQTLVMGMLAIEIATNAVQHAYSDDGEVSVALRAIGENTYEFSISDDGCGFDPLQKYEGIGLTLSTRMAAQLGGKLDIISSADTGTQIQVVFQIIPPSIPLPGQETLSV
jgi:two-component sensor histidine kinase